EQELRIVREIENQDELRKRLDLLRNHAVFLKRKEEFLLSMHQSLIDRLATNDLRAVPDGDGEDEDTYYEAREEYDPTDSDTKGMDSTPIADQISDFNNRFIIH